MINQIRAGIRSITIPIVLGFVGIYVPTATQGAIASPVATVVVAQATGFEALEDFDYWFNLCRLQVDAKDYANALTACEQAIALEPRDANAWALRSGILLQTQAYPDAIASADRALTFDGENSLAITYRCIALANLNNNEPALDSCNDALRVNGNWGDETPALAWFNRGVILSQATQYEQAIIAFDRTLLIEPDDSLALAYRCQALIQLQQYEPAIENCQSALAGNGNWGNESAAIAWVSEGEAYGYLQQYDQAIAAYDQALSLDPNNAMTWTAQAVIFQTLQRNEEALTSYTRAVEIQPTYSLAQVGQCTILNRLQQYEAALPACDAAIQGDGRWGKIGLAEAWNQRSIALTGQGKYEDALASINRAVGMKPDYAEAHNHRGVILWYLGEYEGALAANQRSLELNPANAIAWFNRGIVFRTLERYDEALDAYEHASQLDPDNPSLWANRSVVLWYLQRYPEALTAANQAIALDPTFAQGWYNRATALASLNQYSEALAAYDQVLTLMPDSAEALTGKGIALIQLRRYEEAVVVLQAAVGLNPDQPQAADSLAIATQQFELQQQAQQQAQQQQQRQQQPPLPQLLPPAP